MRYYGEINNDYSIINKKYVDDNLKREYFYGNAFTIPSNVDFFQYSLTEDNYAVIYGLTEDYASLSSDNEQKKHLVIPYEIEGRPTALLGGVFEGQVSLVSITMPKNLINMSVGTSPIFKNCSNLTEIIFSDLWVCGNSDFENCVNLKNVKIGSINMSIIPKLAFYNSGIENVEIIEGIEGIEIRAFAGCSNLKSIKIPKSVLWISEVAFEECENLTEIFYSGTKEEWEKIEISSRDFLSNVTIYYDYVKNEMGKNGTGINSVIFNDIKRNTATGENSTSSGTSTMVYDETFLYTLPEIYWEPIDASIYTTIDGVDCYDFGNIKFTYTETIYGKVGTIYKYLDEHGFYTYTMFQSHAPDLEPNTTVDVCSEDDPIYTTIKMEVLKNDDGFTWNLANGKASFVGGIDNIALNEGDVSFGKNNMSSCKYSFTAGRDNMVRGEASTALGAENKSLGFSCFTVGRENVAGGEDSVAFGSRCKSIGKYSFAHGSRCVVSGGSSVSMGVNTIVKGNASFGIGQLCQVLGNSSFACGESVIVNGRDSFSSGARNVVNGKLSTVFGVDNTSDGNFQFVAGGLNSVSGQYSNAIGRANKVSGDYTFVAGNSLTASGELQVVLGYYNADNPDAAFILGCGEKDNRKNIFEIMKDGNVNVHYGKLNIQGKEVASNDLTNVENETFKNKSKDAGILSLPAYTAEDEGKILKIVNGVPTWVALTVAEEVSF